MSAPNPQPQAPPLAAKLRTVQVGLRPDLEVSRHLFRGEPSYIVRDPVTFHSQRLQPADYDIFVRIESTRPLGDIFDELVAAGKAEPADEERFYGFVMTLHRLGFLQLPVSDDKALYRRYQQKERARRREKLMGFLFLRIPLWNPNAFLDRTIQHARFVFTWPFFILWCAVMLAAGTVLVQRWHEVTEPLQGILVAQNLPLMWITLIGLKIFHEFGHAYACKHFGGHVPEMGAYLIVFTPCAYVDATACWGFKKKSHRLIVCLAGMYIESTIAALAVFVWAFTEPSLLHSAAYNVIFLATVVTVLFNVNPLMRYDGYYILSDMVEIPNLRARASQYVGTLYKRFFLGIRSPGTPQSRRMKAILACYGFAASLYRIVLVLAISAMLATKMFFVGIGVAVFYVGSTLMKTILKMTQYLWYAEETARLRYRSVALSLIVILLLPTALFVIPVPAHVLGRGVVAREKESVVRARENGFLRAIHVKPGQVVPPGQPVADLENDQYVEKVAAARASLNEARIEADLHRTENLNKVRQSEAMAALHRQTLREAEKQLSRLGVQASTGGLVVKAEKEKAIGSFVQAGQPLATIVTGKWLLRVILSEEQVVAADPKEGDRVDVRVMGMPGQDLHGTIERIAPAGSNTVEHMQLTHLGGGDIAVNPETGEATSPWFEVVVRVDESDVPTLQYGMTGKVRFAAAAEPIGVRLSRRFARFFNQLLQS